MKTPQWAASKDAVPDYHVQVTIYEETSGRRVATVFDADAVPLTQAIPGSQACGVQIANASELLRELGEEGGAS